MMMMKRTGHVSALIGAALLSLNLGAATALAADSCTNWVRQPDGTEFRTCVDDSGRQYCEQKYPDGRISRVSCG